MRFLAFFFILILASALSAQEPLYPDSSHFFIYNNEEVNNISNTEFVIEIEWQYELEWDNDSLYFSIITDTDTVNTYWTDQNWNMHNELIKVPDFNGQSFHIGFGLKSDETVSFRGVLIDQVSIKAKGLVELNAEVDMLPQESSFYTPYPNPFNPIIELSYYLDKKQSLDISIIDLNGNKVKTIFSDLEGPGFGSIVWNAGSLSSGIYFVKYELEDSFEIKKITLLK